MALTFYKIPAQNLPWYDFRVVLSKTTYIVELRHNTRMDRWILSLRDSGGAPLILGVPLLLGRDLLGRYRNRDRDLPPGDLYCVDDSGNDAEPTLSSFLTDHSLIYAEEEAT